MDRSFWTKVDDLFNEALALPHAERTTFVESAARDDEQLRHELTSLLAAVDHIERPDINFLATPTTPDSDPSDAPTLAEGDRVGPWTVGPLLGRGGMAEVYRAERADGAYVHTVALKLTEGRPTLVRRFLAERRILAGLQHPHVARLVDGGVTDDGRPYLAMEFVDGATITAYADTHGLDTAARLRLFAQVAEAVAYAHRRLIVHRDLKPSNILVTENDAGQPQVKLLDFGIAKLLEPDAGATVLTQADARPMTPAYAAPEQLAGGEITTAADVYALGVVLYELLTERRPYADTGEKAAALLRAMETEELERPSVVAAREGRPLPKWYAQDLDAIVLQALRYNPDDRYPGVEALAEDVERTLTGAPVAARQGTAGYRLRRFVRRHRVGVAATAAGVLALGLGLGAALWQGAIAAEERDRAQLEAEKSEEVTDFLLDLLAAAEPTTEPTDTLTVRTVLAEGTQRIGEMDAQPEVQAQMLRVMGNVYHRLGQYERAAPLLEKALSLRQDMYDADSPEIAESLTDLGLLHLDQGKHSQAEQAFRRVLSLHQKRPDPEAPVVAQSHSVLARALVAQGLYDEAERHYSEALRMLETKPGETVMQAEVYNNLGTLYQEQGRYDEAEPLHREALTLWRRSLGETHTQVAQGLNELGLVNSRMGRYPEAKVLYEEAITHWQTLYGAEHPTIDLTMSNLGVVLDKMGDYPAAESLKAEVVERHRRRLGPTHPEVGVALGNLAVTVANRGDYARAAALHQEELAIKRAALGSDHPNVALTLHNMGYVLTQQGRYADAVRSYRQALTLWRQALGDDHPSVGGTRFRLGETLYLSGEGEDAETELRQALTIRRASLGSEHPRTAQVLSALGEVLTAQGAYEEAELMLREALAIRETLSDEHRDMQDTRRRLVALYEAWGRPEEAAAYREAP